MNAIQFATNQVVDETDPSNFRRRRVCSLNYYKDTGPTIKGSRRLSLVTNLKIDFAGFVCVSLLEESA
eukprot:2767278-Amphidinium_carterae.1